MALTLAKTLRLLAAEKKAVLQRQTALVANLNKLLPSIGYRVVPLETAGRAEVRPTLPRTARVVATLRGTKPLPCPHCSRTFALPLHLGRHISVMHKSRNASPSSALSPAGAERPAASVAKPARKSRGRAVGKASARRRRVSARTTSKKAPRKS